MAPPPGSWNSLDSARVPSSRKSARRTWEWVAARSLPQSVDPMNELIDQTTPDTSDAEDNESVRGTLGVKDENAIKLPRVIRPPEFYIDELRSRNEFDNDQIAEIQQRTRIFKQQSLDIKDELNRMCLVIHGKSKSKESAVTIAAAAKSYHYYLESEGYFKSEPTFTTQSGSSHIDLHTSTISDGTIFIENAKKLCSTCISDLESIRSKQKVVLVFALTSAGIPKSLSKIVTKSTLRLESKGEPQFDPFTCAHIAFLKCLDDRYKGRMKLEGGRNGPHIRLCLRRLLKSSGKSADKSKIETAVASAFQKISDRQLKRLSKPNNSNKDPDALFFNADDILGPNPGSAKQTDIKEWDELQKLVGLATVKQSIQSHMSGLLINHYRELDEREPLKVGLSRLFIGPPGVGKTTVATLYGGILAKMGILSNGELMVKNASDFIGGYIGHSATQTTKILTDAKGRVLLIDEAYMLNPKRNKNCQFRQEAIDTIVGHVTNAPGEDLCVILCGYKKEMEELLQDANPGFRRRFPIEDAFVFEDFTDAQLGQILDLKTKEQQLEVSKDGREIAMKALKLMKQRPDFGNGGEVVNTVSRAITNFRNRIGPKLGASTESSRIKIIKETKLDPIDFDPEYTRTLTTEQEVEYQFRDLIGLDAEIDLFRSWARRVENMTRNNFDPKPYIPFAFVIKGPPGCGKTTFARRLGTLYFKMGLLATNEVVDVSTKDMIAGYIGQTAIKTRELLEKSLGKVLFIDEAYRLKGRDRHDHSSGSVFAAEARDELVDAMTKPMFFGKIVIILAGYEDRMDDMLSDNPGLRSRFRTQIRFPALSAPSCLALLKKKVADSGVEISIGKYEAAIESVFEKLRQTKGWGNGRDVEDIAKEVVGTVFEHLVDSGQRAADGRMVLETIQRWCVLQNVDLLASEDAPPVIPGAPKAPPVIPGPSRAPPPAQEVSRPPPSARIVQPPKPPPPEPENPTVSVPDPMPTQLSRPSPTPKSAGTQSSRAPAPASEAVRLPTDPKPVKTPIPPPDSMTRKNRADIVRRASPQSRESTRAPAPENPVPPPPPRGPVDDSVPPPDPKVSRWSRTMSPVPRKPVQTNPPTPTNPPAQKPIQATPHVLNKVVQKTQPVQRPVPPKLPLDIAYVRDESFKNGVRKAFEYGILLSPSPPTPSSSKANQEVPSVQKPIRPNLPTPKPIELNPVRTESLVQRPPQSPSPARSLYRIESQFFQTTRPDPTIPRNLGKQKVTPSFEDIYAFPLDRERKETRLLSIVAGDGGNVSYQLQTISLLDKPLYYALSYVWGDPKDTTTITVNGYEIAITKNLKAALTRLQTFKKGHYCKTGIWVDALCISQKDDSEKSYQVPMMEDIYLNARKVIAWLGPEDANNIMLEKYIALSKSRSQQPSTEAFKNIQVEATDAGCSLKHHNPFWRRIWIVQELCIPITPPILLSSRNSMDFDKFLDTHQSFLADDVLKEFPLGPTQKYSFTELEVITAIGNVSRISELAMLRQSLHVPAAHTSKPTKQIDSNIPVWLAVLARNRAASNPSDRIYGLLGMMADKCRNRIPVDYTLHHMEAYRDFFSILWTSTEPAVVEVFDYQLSNRDFPSWVSDISKSNDPVPASEHYENLSWNRPWSPVSTSPATIAGNGKFLSANGVPLGIVNGIESFHMDWDKGHTFLQFERLDDPAVIECLGSLRNLGQRIIQLASNIVLDNIPVESTLNLNGIPPIQVWETIRWPEVMFDKAYREFFSVFWDEVVEQPDVATCMREFQALEKPNVPNSYTELLVLLTAVEKTFRTRELVFTSTGLVCHAPAGVQKGDMLVMLWGCTCPIILRKDDAGPWFKIVNFASVFMWRQVDFADMLSLCCVRNVQKFIIG